MKRFLLLLSFLLIGIVQTFAHDFAVNGIYYNILSGTTNVEVTRNDNHNNSYSGSVTIPSSVSYGGTTYSVTSIGYYAFSGCSGLTSVVIPSSVTSIDQFAFYGCSGLTSVVIPSSVTSIGNRAFESCRGLTSIDIPSSVTSIGARAFYYCSGLTIIDIPSSVMSIGDYAFSYCSGLTGVRVDTGNTVYDSRNNCNAIIKKSNNELITGCKNTVIPSSVTSIGDDAFSGRTGLTGIVIPSSVKNIGTYAFKGCSNLTNIEIPSSVTSIGDDAFYDCSGLTSVVIPSSVTSIGSSAFSGCSSLTSVMMLCPPPPNFTSAYIRSAATIYVCRANYAAYSALGLSNRIEVFDDNILYLPDSELPQGASATLSLKMKNNVSIAGFQFDLQLPESVTIPNGSNGKPYIEVSTSRTTTSKHKVYCNPQPDGTLRVVCASLGNDTFSGTDGEVLKIHVNVASNTALGTHDVVLTHLELTEANNTQHKVARVQYPVTVTAGSYTITATSANTTMGTVSGGGTYAQGATVTLTATPKTGYDFVKWSDGTTANPYTFTATANKSVTAQFQACGLHNWTSTNKADNSTSSHTYNINYSAGQKLSFDWSVSSEASYDWLKVTIDGTEVLKKSGTASGNYSKPFATSGTAVLVVSYTKDGSQSSGSDEGKIYNLTLADYYLTITATSSDTNQGTVTGGGSKKYGTSVTLTATPKTGYEFVQWSDGTTTNPYTFTATANKSVTAQFRAKSYTITATSANAEQGTVTGGGTYTHGATVTLTATPVDGYEFVQWSDGTTANPYTFTATANKSVTAQFRAKSYTITATSADAEQGTVSGGGTYTHGTTVTLTATPKTGYEFVQWSDGTTANPYTFTATADKSVTAQFQEVAPAYLRGDANNDGRVNVQDYVGVAKYILQGAFNGFVLEAADINDDHAINVRDYLGIAQIILYGGAQRISPMTQGDETSTDMDFDALSAELDADGQIAINLNNAAGYAMCQFDVTLPAGMTLTAVTATDRMTPNHTVDFAYQGNNTWRVLVGTLSIAPFKGHEGQLLRLQIEGCGVGMMTIDNALFVTPDDAARNMDAVWLTLDAPTGISGTLDNREPRDLYNLHGVRVQREANRQQGVYIMNGKKTVVK